MLEDISFAVEAGELHGIMGPNGAGKTTFFNVLTGRVKPDRGSVRIAGEDITGLSPHEIAARGLARSFQIMTLFDEFTALENVEVALPEFRARGFDGYRSAVGDKGVRGRGARGSRRGRPRREGARPSPRTCPMATGGRWRSRVALAQRPRVLFLDEPTSGLGADGVTRLAEPDPAPEAAAAIVVIEHDMEFLFGLADRISVVHWGQVIASGTARGAEAESLGAGLEPRAAAMTVAAALPRSEPAIAGGAEALLALRGHPHLLRRDAGAVRRLLRGRAGRGVRAARAERRRQDHDAALDPRPDAARSAAASASAGRT